MHLGKLSLFRSKVIFSLIVLLFMSGCAKFDKSVSELPMEGTWELLSETKIEKDDTTFLPASRNQRMIKILNKTHFSFLRHDLNSIQDSTKIFVAGGGTYKLQDNKYTENLEYCNFREWESLTFNFTIEIKNDTLTQRGIEKVEGLGVDRIIIEKYKRVKS